MDVHSWLTRLGQKPAFWWTMLTFYGLFAIGSLVLIVAAEGRSGLWFTLLSMVLLSVTSVASLMRIHRKRHDEGL